MLSLYRGGFGNCGIYQMVPLTPLETAFKIEPMNAGEILKQVRFDLGYTRGRQTFLDDYGLSWSAEVQRNLEAGITKLDEDRLEELVGKRVLRRDSEVYQQLANATKDSPVKDDGMEIVRGSLPETDSHGPFGYGGLIVSADTDSSGIPVTSFVDILRRDLDTLDKDIDNISTRIRDLFGFVIAGIVVSESQGGDIRYVIANTIHQNLILNDLLTRLMVEVDKTKR